MKRQQQTAKARVASLVSKQKKKLQQDFLSKTNEPFAPVEITNEKDKEVAEFQHTHYAARNGWKPFADYTQKEECVADRKRAVWLYLKQFASAVKAFFCGSDNVEPRGSSDLHLVSINVNDDTDIRLASGARRSSEVRSVMNNIQQHIVLDSKAECVKKWFFAHQPLVTLGRATAGHLFAEFLSWSLAVSGHVGWRWQAFGVPLNLLEGLATHVLLFIGDALKVNDAVFRKAEKLIKAGQGSAERVAALQIHCQIHQICLTRRTLALGFEGYWPNLIRLGHLFEGHSFRQRFYAAMTKVIREDFCFYEVSQLPEKFADWRDAKIKRLRLFSDSGHMGKSGAGLSRRLKTLHSLLAIDNGNAEEPQFVHWCSGKGCCPNGAEGAAAAMVEHYLDLFAFMCLPLLYRWKHAGAANSFVRDGFVLHRVLPRTLQAMKTVKCIFAAAYCWGSILERKELATLTGRAPELCGWAPWLGSVAGLCGWALSSSCPPLGRAPELWALWLSGDSPSAILQA